MKYIKKFENINNISAEMSHEKIRECSKIIQKKAGINKGNGFDNWYTDNWCFNRDPHIEFFCYYHFHFVKKSDAIKLLEKYLFDNNIKFKKSTYVFNESLDVIQFDFTKEDIFYYLIEDENPNLTEEEIKTKIDILLEEERLEKASKKYNI